MENIGNSIVTFEDIGDPTILQRCLFGEIFLIREFLQKTSTYELVTGATLAAIRQATGSKIADQIRINGFDRLHYFVASDRLEGAVAVVDRSLRSITSTALGRMVRRGFAYKQPLWILDHPVVRFFIPYDLTFDHREKFQQFRLRYGDGRITTIRPHRDSWFVEPLTSINIWVAMGLVVPGNGISLFTNTYNRALKYEPRLGVARDQPVGKPVNFAMCPGDALVFHAEHLHASELNRTEYTRSVLSFRVALKHPGLSSSNPGRYCKVYPRIPISFLSIHPKVRRIQRRLSGVARSPATKEESSSARDGEQPVVEMRLPEGPVAEPSSIAAANLDVDQPRAISKDLCLIKFSNGEVRVFHRRCPHEGADLALGYLKGRQIICPWHNLPFDLDTGKSPCATVPSIGALPCDIRDGSVELPEPYRSES